MMVLIRTAARRVDLTRGLRSGTRLLTRMGVVGLLAFVVDVGVFNTLRHAGGLGPLTSKTIAVLVATSVAFGGNLRWTFYERHSRHVTAAYVMFFAANGVGLLIALACLSFSRYVLGLTSPLSENIAGNVVGLGLGTLFRFWTYHTWVFRDVRAPTHDRPAPPTHEPPHANPSRSDTHAR